LCLCKKLKHNVVAAAYCATFEPSSIKALFDATHYSFISLSQGNTDYKMCGEKPDHMNATVAATSNKGDSSHEQWMHAEQFSDTVMHPGKLECYCSNDCI